MLTATPENFGEATDFEVMDRLVSVSGLRLIDVGCGAGALTRALAERGAEVLGVEPDPIQAEKNRAAEPMTGLSFTEGVAQELSAADASVDGVFFKYSLHHVPADALDTALAEAARVLKPDTGFLYVVEPVMAGSYAELTRPFNDETAVRQLAYEALARCAAPRFAEAREVHYAFPRRYRDFETFLVEKLGLTYKNHQRARIDTPEVRAMFEAGKSDGGGYGFELRLRANFYRGRESAI